VVILRLDDSSRASFGVQKPGNAEALFTNRPQHPTSVPEGIQSERSSLSAKQHQSSRATVGGARCLM
jgi:hypothetical protein